MSTGSTSSNISTGSTPTSYVGICRSGIPAPVRYSSTLDNPMRRFVGCDNYKSAVKNCWFFRWFDLPTCDRGVEFGRKILKKNHELASSLRGIEMRNEELWNQLKKEKLKGMLEDVKIQLAAKKQENRKIKFRVLLMACVLVIWFLFI